MKPLWIVCIFLAISSMTGVAALQGMSATVAEEEEEQGLVDDWEYPSEIDREQRVKSMMTRTPSVRAKSTRMSSVRAESMMSKPLSMPSPSVPRQITSGLSNSFSPQSTASKSIGFSVGGAKDTGNFQQNLKNGFLPKYSSLTYEGLYYDYFFDTGASGECKELFCPSYSKAVNKDLYSGESSYYLTLGFNSGLTEESFQRKKLNLVVVLDISGSMDSRFDRYSYDVRSGKEVTEEQKNKSKMALANESIVAMMKHLSPEDRFGVTLFNSQAYAAKPLRLVKQTDMEAISKHILAVTSHGGTNWKAGFDEGLNMFASMEAKMADPAIYENRIIFLTDAMPNRGELGKDGLFAMVRDAAKKGIHTSFIGIGVDFNTDLVEHVSKIRGANYFSVHSAPEFKKRLVDEFDFMVTPLVFDLALQVESEDYTIEGVYGSPEAHLATGEIMKINTLFPSATEEEAVKGGVVLLKLKKVGESNGPIVLQVKYTDRTGKQFNVKSSVHFTDDEIGYDNRGIHKAVLLTEYVSLVKNWILDARKGCNDKVERPFFIPYMDVGLINPIMRPEFHKISEWERTSCSLQVSEGYRNFFTLFSSHFKKEMKEINDPILEKEFKVLQLLIGKTAVAGGNGIDDWVLK